MTEVRIKYKVGTLVSDDGRLGVISGFFPQGSTSFENAHRINWRDNYEIYFATQHSYIIGAIALERLVEQGQIKILEKIPLDRKA